ncbi:Zinc finger BED domain-containing protein 1 [Anabarilius grahami]|uniref:Zinc finger BED domain-containing protein 1 n=1 Tax=Anabarilius grahami TaxID=495550 RepID=A0A3N0YD05_ANAGA|nr:Zinc finger BED domain-containing protein 1 [Anabarilius grahami]
MKTKIVTDLEKRYSVEKGAFMLLNKASYPDPRFHRLVHLKEEQRWQVQVAILEEMKQANVAGGTGSEAAAGQPRDQQPAEKTALSAMGCLFGDTYCTDSPDQDISLLLQKEMLMYEQESPIPAQQNPLMWWKTLGSGRYPHVAQMAKKYLSIPGSSVRSERVFSSAGNIITKKLAGGIEDTAAWMTNIGNELGQVLNSVLTTAEGAAVLLASQSQRSSMLTGIAAVSVPAVLNLFRPWKCIVRLDIFHFMRRFNCGLTTEHHPLYGTFCSKLSSCIFEWDQEDVKELKAAKRGEWKKSHGGQAPTEAQLMTSISPEFTPPGKPTEERIAVEYLLAQSNRGDQLIGDHSDMPEVPSEESEDDSGLDTTVCHAADLRAGDSDPPVDVMEAQVTSQVGDTGPKSPDAEVSEEEEDDTAIPSTSGQCDSRGVLGWEAVDALATYLVGLNQTITALSSQEEANIVQLYMALHAMAKVPLKYSQRVKKKTLPGPWRASRKRSGSAPGQQAAER